ncbi:chemotaxis protein CheX [Paenibacillus thermoaerophilus]|jgi:chemotaxis protein CheX|uniref:Chemotaxis protein CheX n=1 Tax=Paenibacillus thermoaerophilus TaxID=1215385 RepID=A0ABW2V257_9BACL|nr:chemotaxis protein CheX [Paenibacillus thermoaerophilus]TMV17747.1 chemotaxis protein CheX [Paenibacillus thermoaerophilus]
MKAEVINPFLESARSVLEQLIQVRPTMGNLGLQEIKVSQDYIHIRIGITGQMTGNVMFGLPEPVALKLVSVMMGGFAVSELDEISESAISELGNMISGNASTLLYNQGIHIDITPPAVIRMDTAQQYARAKALTVPLFLEQIGEMNIQVIVA